MTCNHMIMDTDECCPLCGPGKQPEATLADVLQASIDLERSKKAAEGESNIEYWATRALQAEEAALRLNCRREAAEQEINSLRVVVAGLEAELEALRAMCLEEHHEN